MPTSRRLLAGAFGLALAVAACGGSSAASSAPAASSSSGGSAATTAPAMTEAPAASDNAQPSDAAASDSSGGGVPSFAAGAASDLEAMLPDQAGGVTFTKLSFDGANMGMLSGSIDTTEIDPLLKKYGKTLADVSIAMATPADSSATATGTLIAIRIKGVPAAEILGLTNTDLSSMTKTTIGGKDVYSEGGGGMNVIVYPKDDVLFEVVLTSDAVAKEVLAKLP
jgi:hypothetical protein